MTTYPAWIHETVRTAPGTQSDNPSPPLLSFPRVSFLLDLLKLLETSVGWFCLPGLTMLPCAFPLPILVVSETNPFKSPKTRTITPPLIVACSALGTELLGALVHEAIHERPDATPCLWLAPPEAAVGAQARMWLTLGTAVGPLLPVHIPQSCRMCCWKQDPPFTSHTLNFSGLEARTAPFVAS